MGTTAIAVLVIFVLSVVMIMSGRGGGNFYVAALVLLGTPMHTASTTSQFILLASALSGALIFGKAKDVYQKEYATGPALYTGLESYFYNTERPHQSLAYQTPAEVHFGS